jgi:hypothetical protein
MPILAEAGAAVRLKERSGVMDLETESYLKQVERWPASGRHIIAQYDDASVVVYQAYRPSIGRFAAEHGYFGGEFSLSRMSWIKTNFLWIMYRSGWGRKENQEVTLAVRIQRSGFEAILREAVNSTYEAAVYPSPAEWKSAIDRSDVRLQWDPDHDPSGAKVARRAIQLGLRGEVLARYAREWIVSIHDISRFVREQYAHVQAGDYASLITPRETVFPLAAELAAKLGVTASV